MASLLGTITQRVVTALVAFFAALATGLGLWINLFGEPFANAALLVLTCVALWVVFFFAVNGLWLLLDRLAKRRNQHPPHPLAHPVAWCIGAGVVMVVCWIPLLLAGYPGYFSYDAGLEDSLMQWAQVEAGTLNAHHPIIHTLFVEATIKGGMALFGSFNAGICFSVVLQALIIAAVLALICFWLVQDGMGRAGFIASVAYFALDPVVGLFALCTTKDSLFSVAVVAYGMLLVHLFQADPQAPRSKRIRLYVALVLVGFFLCIMRTNALAALVVAAPFLYVVMRKNARRILLACIAASLALSAVWLGPISMALHVERSPIGVWNALGIPMQQLARCATSDGVSSEDHDKIADVLGTVEYKQNLSDYARNSFAWTIKSKKEALDLYVYLGLHYPGIYTEAAILQTEDAWSPFAVIDTYSPEGSGVTSTFDARTMLPGTKEPQIEWLWQAIYAFSYDEATDRMPVVHLLTCIAFYLLLTLLCLARALITRNKKALCFVLPLTILAASSLLGPCMIIRYFLYLFLAVPALLHFLMEQPPTHST